MKAFLQGTWLGHPLHPILVHLPAGLWPAAFAFDLLTNVGIGGNGLYQTSYYAILVGIVVAVLAVPAGVADLWDVSRDKPAWKLGIAHAGLNVVAIGLSIVNVWARWEQLAQATTVDAAGVLLSLAVTLIIFTSGYLGGRMIYDYGISVARLSKERWRSNAESGRARVPPQ